MGPVAAGVTLSLAVTGARSCAGALAGPTVVHRGSAAVEAVLAALLAGLYGVAREAWLGSRQKP